MSHRHRLNVGVLEEAKYVNYSAALCITRCNCLLFVATEWFVWCKCVSIMNVVGTFLDIMMWNADNWVRLR